MPNGVTRPRRIRASQFSVLAIPISALVLYKCSIALNRVQGSMLRFLHATLANTFYSLSISLKISRYTYTPTRNCCFMWASMLTLTMALFLLALVMPIVQISQAIHFTNQQWNVQQNQPFLLQWVYDIGDPPDNST